MKPAVPLCARPIRATQDHSIFPQLGSPCVPTLVRAAPSGPSWIHEIKRDG
jgi:hypothetical protein